MSTPIGVAAVGDVLDIQCWSNIPYYFYKIGHKAGLFNEPWQLNLQDYNTNRKIWNLFRLLTGQGIGGYQYSNAFLNKAEYQIPTKYFSSSVISFNQTFPRASSINKKGGKIYYFIDATLYDLFNEPDYEIVIPQSMKEKALKLEKENYQRAEAVVSMGSWVKDSLINYYNLPEEKIFSILPGANIELPSDFQTEEKKGCPGIDRDLILGFVGKDWRRKGLPLLIEICTQLKQRGYKAKIKAIGNCPDELAGSDCLEYSGYINKQTETNKFISTISSCDIGCLFSTTEALGISTLEFLRVGVPVAGFYHQGLKDTLLDNASYRFGLDSSASEIASIFEQYIKDQSQQMEMNKYAVQYSNYVTWERCIKEWKNLLQR